MKISNKQSKTRKEKTFSFKILILTVSGFVLLCIVSFLNEILDMPHLLIGATKTRPNPNWQEAIIETVIAVGVGIMFLLILFRRIKRAAIAESKLRESEAKYRTLVENAKDGIVIIQDGVFKFVNTAGAKLTGYTPEEIMNANFLTFVPENYHDLILKRYRDRMEGKNVSSLYDLELIRKDNTKFAVEINANLIYLENKPADLAIIRDVTGRKLLEEKLKRSLNEKTIMLKEIHHRVKNNLQLISSLLNLQSAQIKDEATRKIFDESKNRIYSIALIHEKLYGSKDFSRIDFDAYIKNLANLLYRTYRTDPERIESKITVKDVSLGIDTAVPCGLILNELISNALQHAFPPSWQGKGKIEVLFHSLQEHEFEIIVKDNGVGIPADLDIRRTDSLGLHLVTLLAEGQLGGKINLDRRNGTKFQIIFKSESCKNSYHRKE